MRLFAWVALSMTVLSVVSRNWAEEAAKGDTVPRWEIVRQILEEAMKKAGDDDIAPGLVEVSFDLQREEAQAIRQALIEHGRLKPKADFYTYYLEGVPRTGVASFDSLNLALGLEEMLEFDTNLNCVLLKFPDDMNTRAIAEAYAKLPYVKFANPVIIYRPAPDDPLTVQLETWAKVKARFSSERGE